MKQALVCLIILMFASNAYCQNKTYIGWFNDANRTYAGRGCWNGPGEYLNCHDETGWLEGWWGTGEAWLWVYSEDGIQSIQFTVSTVGEWSGVGACIGLTQGWNDSIVGSHGEGCLPAQLGGNLIDMQASFSECQSGWFWVYKAACWRRGGWELYICGDDVDAPLKATLCDENGTKRSMTRLSQFHLDPVPADECESGSIIGTESISWGAIKELFK